MHILDGGMYHFTITIHYQEEYFHDNELTMDNLVYTEYRIMDGIP